MKSNSCNIDLAQFTRLIGMIIVGISAFRQKTLQKYLGKKFLYRQSKFLIDGQNIFSRSPFYYFHFIDG